jgi:hypothetical protein
MAQGRLLVGLTLAVIDSDWLLACEEAVSASAAGASH